MYKICHLYNKDSFSLKLFSLLCHSVFVLPCLGSTDCPEVLCPFNHIYFSLIFPNFINIITDTSPVRALLANSMIKVQCFTLFWTCMHFTQLVISCRQSLLHFMNTELLGPPTLLFHWEAISHVL